MILFVCTGNRFRSMLAEALAKKKYPGESFKSCGTDATGPVYEAVKKIARENGIEDQANYSPTQVSEDAVDNADRIVCMKERHRDFITTNFDCDKRKLEVWDIPDADPSDDLEPIFGEIEDKVEDVL